MSPFKLSPLHPTRSRAAVRQARRVSGGRWPALSALMGVLALSPMAHAGPEHVNQAVVILRAACGLADAKLDVRKPGDGRLHLRLFIGNTLRGATNLVHQDLDGFTRTTMEVMSEQPSGLSACMDPAVNQIIATLLEMPQNVASIPLAPAPSAAPAAPAGGGYVPPVMAAPPAPAPAPAPMTVVATPAPTAAPAPAAVSGDSGGPLQLALATLEVNPAQYSSWNAHVVGTLGIDIRNATGGMLRVAIIDPWPVVQLEGGLRMGFKSINGITINRNASISNCGAYISQFTTIRPGQTLVTSAVFDVNMGGRDAPNVASGRLSGEMLVYEESTQRCTVEPLSATRINIRMNR